MQGLAKSSQSLNSTKTTVQFCMITMKVFNSVQVHWAKWYKYTIVGLHFLLHSLFYIHLVAIYESATNFWLLVLSIFHNKRIIKQASLSHSFAEYNLKVSSWDL